MPSGILFFVPISHLLGIVGAEGMLYFCSRKTENKNHNIE